ncbi:MAG: transposase [Solirubrobacteraceae bacterium]
MTPNGITRPVAERRPNAVMGLDPSISSRAYRVGANDGLELLESWLQWARRSRQEPFRELARRITEQCKRVEAAFKNGLSNGRVEQINTQIRLIMRRGFGYHSSGRPLVAPWLGMYARLIA